MYLRTTKVKRPDGHIDEYIRLVESHWNNGSPRHRVVCNLGRKDLLAPHIDALAHLIKGETTPHVEAGRYVRRRSLGLGRAAGGAPLLGATRPAIDSRLGAEGWSARGTVRPSAGVGCEPVVRTDERARDRPMAGDGLCLRSVGETVVAGVA